MSSLRGNSQKRLKSLMATQAAASRKGTAVVTLEKDVPFEMLKKAVEDKGYTVIE